MTWINLVENTENTAINCIDYGHTMVQLHNMCYLSTNTDQCRTWCSVDNCC